MTGDIPAWPTIKRTFRDLSDAEIAEIAKPSTRYEFGLTAGFDWDELLRSQRVLIVSEAGTGKTYECQAQQRKLWASGEPAFFLDLATMATSPIREMLSSQEEARLDAWLRSQSEIATFFLDSIDELKLTLGKFDQALQRLNKTLAGQLGRARIIITTRPVPVDRELIASHLPIPASEMAAPTGEAFADMIIDRKRQKPEKDNQPKAWRYVGLMSLSREQMREFATLQGVTDPDALLADIQQRDAEQFAERPQDLIELCSDWREHCRIRTHRDQVESNIANKLKPNIERKEGAELSESTATEGASRLALAAVLTRKLTLRYGANSDDVHASEAALDVSKVLTDWSAEVRARLLERPLFGFASYGRVRFHHRSVLEFLAAKHLNDKVAQGVSIKSIKRLLFADTAQGSRTVRPSMRAITAWLALFHDTVFDEVVALDPAVVLENGDPQSLRPAQRVRALEAYVERYGRGGWRGLNTPSIQVHRFASPELADVVNRLWALGIENPEVRGLLLRIIGAGKLTSCADIAHTGAMDGRSTVHERSLAIDALVQVNDPRLEAISLSVASDPARWPDAMARQAAIDLFPAHMPAPRLAAILGRVKQGKRSISDLGYRLPQEIETADLSSEYLDQLRHGLTGLISEGAAWEHDKFPHLRTKRPDLLAALVSVCRRQAAEGVTTEPWLTSSLLAVRMSSEAHNREGGSLTALRQALAGLSADTRETAFWKEALFLRGLYQARDAWHRVYDLSQLGGVQLHDEKDAAWVRKRLADPNEPIEHREMMLWSEMLLLNREATDHRELLEQLKPFVSDAPRLTEIIDGRLKPQAINADLRRMEAAAAKRTKHVERRDAKAHASWVMFWREVVQNPDAVFATDRAAKTAWNLWNAVERSGKDSRASGWNRRFIEHQFGKVVADKLRETMMAAWRRDTPTLSSERPEAEKNTFLVRWQFGLAGIAAEAEDPNWAKRLTEREAELACRYAPMELNGFPSWLESLAVQYPAAVDRILGQELSRSLQDVARSDAYSIYLQNLAHASALIATLFAPRICTWVTKIAEMDVAPNTTMLEQNLRRAIDVLIKSGNEDDRCLIQTTARQRLASGLGLPLAEVWLAALLRLNAAAGVEAVETGLENNTASTVGVGVQLFAHLFGHRHESVNLRAPNFSPRLLFRLLRLAYQHIRLEEDAKHEGSYSPDMRDDAETSRNAILTAILATTGAEGWAVKLEMAADPLFAHIKDRVIALAQERAAEEADDIALTEFEFAILDKTGESPPATRDAMFALMRDRLDDVDDFLLQDTSPRELWATIQDERVMRRELARVLKDAGNRSYTIDQESVTADEKETDIRFRSSGSKQQGTIELKLGDNRSGTDLFNTLRDQLLTKYMASDECRAGYLVVTIAKERLWEHPKTGSKVNFEDLIALLKEEARRLSEELGGAAKLMAKGIDLRPRLATKKVN